MTVIHLHVVAIVGSMTVNVDAPLWVGGPVDLATLGDSKNHVRVRGVLTIPDLQIRARLLPASGHIQAFVGVFRPADGPIAVWKIELLVVVVRVAVPDMDVVGIVGSTASHVEALLAPSYLPPDPGTTSAGTAGLVCREAEVCIAMAMLGASVALRVPIAVIVVAIGIIPLLLPRWHGVLACASMAVTASASRHAALIAEGRAEDLRPVVALPGHAEVGDSSLKDVRPVPRTVHPSVHDLRDTCLSSSDILSESTPSVAGVGDPLRHRAAVASCVGHEAV